MRFGEKSVMNKVELLAPSGDMNKLKTALYYGADAVYIGGKSLSLRALAGNFSRAEIENAVKLCHACGKRVYVTVNIFARTITATSVIWISNKLTIALIPRI